MFSKKKKKLDISLPKNFEHRVHTGFDKRENRYVGLPPQWAGIVSPTPSAKGALSSRPTPLIDPSEITPTEVLDLKVIKKQCYHHKSCKPIIKIHKSLMTFRPPNNQRHDRYLCNGFFLFKSTASDQVQHRFFLLPVVDLLFFPPLVFPLTNSIKQLCTL